MMAALERNSKAMPRLGIAPAALDSVVRDKRMESKAKQTPGNKSLGGRKQIGLRTDTISRSSSFGSLSQKSHAKPDTLQRSNSSDSFRGLLPSIKRSHITSSIRDLRSRSVEVGGSDEAVDQGTSEDSSPEGLGQRLMLCLRCSQLNEAERVVAKLEKMYAEDHGKARSITEKNGNTHMHLLMKVRIDAEDTAGYNIARDRVIDLCDKLIIMGASLDDENHKQETVASICRDYDMLDELRLRQRQRRRQRGNSLLGEAMTFRKAGNAVMAALAFKRGLKTRKQSKQGEANLVQKEVNSHSTDGTVSHKTVIKDHEKGGLSGDNEKDHASLEWIER